MSFSKSLFYVIGSLLSFRYILVIWSNGVFILRHYSPTLVGAGREFYKMDVIPFIKRHDGNQPYSTSPQRIYL